MTLPWRYMVKTWVSIGDFGAIGSRATACTDAQTYFSLVQNLYTFLSGSTYRWTLLKNAVENENTTRGQNAPEDKSRARLPKRLSDTRWSARADALRSLSLHYDTYKSALQTLGKNKLQKNETRTDAVNLVKKLVKRETAFLTSFWSTILERINETSKLLQSETIDLGTAVALLKSLLVFLTSQRHNFEQYNDQANNFCIKTKDFEKTNTPP
jgi:hypothetical protein